MTDPSVTPDPWAALAAELHSMADDAEKLIGLAAPGLVSLDIQPFGEVSHPPVPQERAITVQAVDDVAFALLGEVGETHEMSSGTFHHKRYGKRGRIQVNVYQAIADPSALDKDEEIARLRGEIEELRATVALDALGLSFSRAADDQADDPTPVSPAQVPLHTGGMTDGGLVDETVQFGSAHWGPAGDTGEVCQGAPAGYETDCGIPGAHGPHPVEPQGRIIGRATVDAPTKPIINGLAEDGHPCAASLHIPTPGETCGVCGAEGMRSGQHFEVLAASEGDTYSAECACGNKFTGFDSFAEARSELALHIRVQASL